MENLLEKVKQFIKRELDNTTTNPEHSFMSGYRLALIDVRDYIKNNEKEQEMVGKFGYFWDDEHNPVYYDKLISINTNDEFGSDISYSCNGMLPFENFSLTPPKHLK